MTAVKKKLLEVALLLDAIHEASTREKSIRHGHPSTLHLWWARRPLAGTRLQNFGARAAPHRGRSRPAELDRELLAIRTWPVQRKSRHDWL